MKVEVLIDGKSFVMASIQVENFANYLEHSPDAEKIANLLIKSPHPGVRRTVAGSEKLSAESLRAALAEEWNPDVMEALLNNWTHRSNIAADDLVKALEKQPKLLAEVGSNIEYFFNNEESSDEAVAKLTEMIIKSPDTEGRYRVASNGSTPKKLLKLLAKDSEPYVSYAAEKTLEN